MLFSLKIDPARCEATDFTGCASRLWDYAKTFPRDAGQATNYQIFGKSVARNSPSIPNLDRGNPHQAQWGASIRALQQVDIKLRAVNANHNGCRALVNKERAPSICETGNVAYRGSVEVK